VKVPAFVVFPRVAPYSSTIGVGFSPGKSTKKRGVSQVVSI
jgi:hypothetical protein